MVLVFRRCRQILSVRTALYRPIIPSLLWLVLIHVELEEEEEELILFPQNNYISGTRMYHHMLGLYINIMIKVEMGNTNIILSPHHKQNIFIQSLIRK